MDRPARRQLLHGASHCFCDRTVRIYLRSAQSGHDVAYGETILMYEFREADRILLAHTLEPRDNI
jgi:hypothetical protein